MKLDWRTLSKEDQKTLMARNLYKCSKEALLDMSFTSQWDLVDDVLNIADESDENRLEVMKEIERHLGESFYD